MALTSHTYTILTSETNYKYTFDQSYQWKEKPQRGDLNEKKPQFMNKTTSSHHHKSSKHLPTPSHYAHAQKTHPDFHQSRQHASTNKQSRTRQTQKRNRPPFFLILYMLNHFNQEGLEKRTFPKPTVWIIQHYRTTLKIFNIKNPFKIKTKIIVENGRLFSNIALSTWRHQQVWATR